MLASLIALISNLRKELLLCKAVNLSDRVCNGELKDASEMSCLTKFFFPPIKSINSELISGIFSLSLVEEASEADERDKHGSWIQGFFKCLCVRGDSFSLLASHRYFLFQFQFLKWPELRENLRTYY